MKAHGGLQRPQSMPLSNEKLSGKGISEAPSISISTSSPNLARAATPGSTRSASSGRLPRCGPRVPRSIAVREGWVEPAVAAKVNGDAWYRRGAEEAQLIVTPQKAALLKRKVALTKAGGELQAFRRAVREALGCSELAMDPDIINAQATLLQAETCITMCNEILTADMPDPVKLHQTLGRAQKLRLGQKLFKDKWLVEARKQLVAWAPLSGVIGDLHKAFQEGPSHACEVWVQVIETNTFALNREAEAGVSKVLAQQPGVWAALAATLSREELRFQYDAPWSQRFHIFKDFKHHLEQRSLHSPDLHIRLAVKSSAQGVVIVLTGGPDNLSIIERTFAGTNQPVIRGYSASLESLKECMARVVAIVRKLGRFACREALLEIGHDGRSGLGVAAESPSLAVFCAFYQAVTVGFEQDGTSLFQPHVESRTLDVRGNLSPTSPRHECGCGHVHDVQAVVSAAASQSIPGSCAKLAKIIGNEDEAMRIGVSEKLWVILGSSTHGPPPLVQIDCLLKQRAELDCRNAEGNTALHVAAAAAPSWKTLEAAAELLEGLVERANAASTKELEVPDVITRKCNILEPLLLRNKSGCTPLAVLLRSSIMHREKCHRPFIDALTPEDGPDAAGPDGHGLSIRQLMGQKRKVGMEDILVPDLLMRAQQVREPGQALQLAEQVLKFIPTISSTVDASFHVDRERSAERLAVSLHAHLEVCFAGGQPSGRMLLRQLWQVAEVLLNHGCTEPLLVPETEAQQAAPKAVKSRTTVFQAESQHISLEEEVENTELMRRAATELLCAMRGPRGADPFDSRAPYRADLAAWLWEHNKLTTASLQTQYESLAQDSNWLLQCPSANSDKGHAFHDVSKTELDRRADLHAAREHPGYTFVTQRLRCDCKVQGHPFKVDPPECPSWVEHDCLPRAFEGLQQVLPGQGFHEFLELLGQKPFIRELCWCKDKDQHPVLRNACSCGEAIRSQMLVYHATWFQALMASRQAKVEEVIEEVLDSHISVVGWKFMASESQLWLTDGGKDSRMLAMLDRIATLLQHIDQDLGDTKGTGLKKKYLKQLKTSANFITDLNEIKIIVNDVTEVETLYSKLQAQGPDDIVRLVKTSNSFHKSLAEDRYVAGQGGYRVIKFYLVVAVPGDRHAPNGSRALVELQVHFQNFYRLIPLMHLPYQLSRGSLDWSEGVTNGWKRKLTALSMQMEAAGGRILLDSIEEWGNRPLSRHDFLNCFHRPPYHVWKDGEAVGWLQQSPWEGTVEEILWLHEIARRPLEEQAPVHADHAEHADYDTFLKNLLGIKVWHHIIWSRRAIRVPWSTVAIVLEAKEVDAQIVEALENAFRHKEFKLLEVAMKMASQGAFTETHKEQFDDLHAQAKTTWEKLCDELFLERETGKPLEIPLDHWHEKFLADAQARQHREMHAALWGLRERANEITDVEMAFIKEAEWKLRGAIRCGNSERIRRFIEIFIDSLPESLVSEAEKCADCVEMTHCALLAGDVDQLYVASISPEKLLPENLRMFVKHALNALQLDDQKKVVHAKTRELNMTHTQYMAQESGEASMSFGEASPTPSPMQSPRSPRTPFKSAKTSTPLNRRRAKANKKQLAPHVEDLLEKAIRASDLHKLTEAVDIAKRYNVAESLREVAEGVLQLLQDGVEIRNEDDWACLQCSEALVICMDSSRSMLEYNGSSKSRLSVAVEALLPERGQLQNIQRFECIAFGGPKDSGTNSRATFSAARIEDFEDDGQCNCCFGGDAPVLEHGQISVAMYKEFLESLLQAKTHGTTGTNIRGALEMSYSALEASEAAQRGVLLVTDGCVMRSFDEDENNGELQQIEEMVQSNKEHQNAALHVRCVGDFGHAAWLRGLAESSGGSFMLVRRPSMGLTTQQLKLQICFVVDTTCRQSWLDAVRDCCTPLEKNLSDEINQKYPKANLRVEFAAVSYSKASPSPAGKEMLAVEPFGGHTLYERDARTASDFEQCGAVGRFTPFAEDVSEWMKRLKTQGSSDGPTDLTGALRAASGLPWSGLCRLLVVLTGSPCHGSEYHDMEADKDRFADVKKSPSGNPVGALKVLKGLNIVIFVLRVREDETETMLHEFREAWSDLGAMSSIQDQVFNHSTDPRSCDLDVLISDTALGALHKY